MLSLNFIWNTFIWTFGWPGLTQEHRWDVFWTLKHLRFMLSLSWKKFDLYPITNICQIMLEMISLSLVVSQPADNEGSHCSRPWSSQPQLWKLLIKPLFVVFTLSLFSHFLLLKQMTLWASAASFTVMTEVTVDILKKKCNGKWKGFMCRMSW